MADFEYHEQLAFRALAESRASSLTHTREYHVQVAQVEATLALAAAVAALSRKPADGDLSGS
ncbi:hypothetical protein [Streptacidiphilus jiangxiensis]|uniref:Uncharacterized protein n=1 Tax=Streptacidiphilus jiangxiensis TaxID=235985 RepID=A0A1H7SS05_STRJI|nr:hypothetical protein [Streptacidiphilus jiangxiensis]SEL74307.1 hypothetical protein SAMN05414137_112133 [Streptacidiphilus jiangxiensis]